MIHVKVGTHDDEILGDFIVVLHEKMVAKYPEHEFTITVVKDELTSVDSDGEDDPAHPDPDPDEVYKFVVDAWVTFVIGESWPEQSDEE